MNSRCQAVFPVLGTAVPALTMACLAVTQPPERAGDRRELRR
jgi:hypothetical protein